MDGFIETYRLTEKEVLGAIGKAAVEHITQDDLVVLIGIGQAIKDGDTTVQEAFKSKQTATNIMTQKVDVPIEVKVSQNFSEKVSQTGKLDFE